MGTDGDGRRMFKNKFYVTTTPKTKDKKDATKGACAATW